MVKKLSDVGNFLRALRIRMRFGKISRAPLRLLRLEVRGAAAECDWMARQADQWDSQLARAVGDNNVSIQALEDAIAIRNLIFCALPEINTASLRVFRQLDAGETELIITGTVSRDEPGLRLSPSLTMRAKLLGLKFWLENGVLEALQSEECAMSF